MHFAGLQPGALQATTQGGVGCFETGGEFTEEVTRLTFSGAVARGDNLARAAEANFGRRHEIHVKLGKFSDARFDGEGIIDAGHTQLQKRVNGGSDGGLSIVGSADGSAIVIDGGAE